MSDQLHDPIDVQEVEIEAIPIKEEVYCEGTSRNIKSSCHLVPCSFCFSRPISSFASVCLFFPLHDAFLDEDSLTQDDLDQEPLVALNPNDELMSNDWSNDADENDVAVFPSSAPEVMVETTSTISKKRKAHGMFFS